MKARRPGRVHTHVPNAPSAPASASASPTLPNPPRPGPPQARAPLLILDVEFPELHLGHSAPIVTSAVHSDSPEAVQVDMEVRWVGDLGTRGVLAFRTRFGRRTTVTISDVVVTASVRLSLAPLVPTPPGFAAASLSLLSRPLVRYRLSGVSAASAAVPELNAFLTRALCDCACAAALWPRRVALPILPDVDLSTLTPEPAGVLRVVVLCAPAAPPPPPTTPRPRTPPTPCSRSV